MSGFQDVFSHPFLNALGWALLHFLWQGAVVALVLAGLLFVLKGYAARIRYGLALSTMLFIPILFVVTTWQIWQSSQEIAVYSQPVSPAVPSASSLVTPLQVEQNQSTTIGAEMVSQPATRLNTSAIAESPRFSARLQQRVVNQIESLLPWVVSLWLVGLLALSFRLTIGLRHVQRLKSEGVVPATARLQAHLVDLCERMRISRSVHLLESALIQVPTAIGWLRPVVLLPASALTGLTPSQLEMIVAHELAHIRRHDYLLNLIQTVIEILLFYHPAIWWIGNRVRVERENCCDDLAVAVCGNPLTYAHALTTMEQLRSESPQLAMAANNGSLLHRIRRLVNPLSLQSDRLARWMGGVIAIAAVVTVGVTISCFNVSTTVTDEPMVAMPPMAPIPPIPPIAPMPPTVPHFNDKWIFEDTTTGGNAKHNEELDWTLDSAEISILDAQTTIGRISFEGSDAAQVVVRAKKEVRAPTSEEAQEFAKTIQIHVVRRENEIKIYEEHPKPSKGISFAVHYEIQGPSTVDVKCRKDIGPIQIRQIEGAVDAVNSNGSIELQNVSGHLNLHTSIGSIKLQKVSGRVYAVTSNGGIELQNVSGYLNLHASIGSIKLQEVSGRVHAETSNGRIEATVESLEDEGLFSTNIGRIDVKIRKGIAPITATSSNGTIEVTLPADFSGKLDAKTSNGQIRSEFTTLAGVTKRGLKNTLVGKIGDGGEATIKLQTSIGRIQIKKWQHETDD